MRVYPYEQKRKRENRARKKKGKDNIAILLYKESEEKRGKSAEKRMAPHMPDCVFRITDGSLHYSVYLLVFEKGNHRILDLRLYL